MKNKIIALTIATALTLAPTAAYAAVRTNNNCDVNSLLKSTEGTAQYKLTVNGKTFNLNSIDIETLLNNIINSQKTVTKPVVTKPSPTPAPAPVKPVPAPEKPVTQPAPNPVKPAPAPTPTPAPVSSVSAYEQKVVELVNVERQKAGLPALKMDAQISNVARTKSKDMATNNYFAHQSPTYGSAGDMLTKFGIRWTAWGENIASGQRTPESVVTAWMNSPGHRANILNSNFTKIGVGYAVNSNGTPYWTQMFIK